MKNYLIIGGSSGIGRALVKQLKNEGNTVFASYNQTTDFASEENYFHYSVNDEFDASFLPERLDGIAYCPGSINLMPFKRIKPEDFLSDLNLQVIGAVRVIQAVLPKLLLSEHASIVLFSTVAVQSGFNFHSQVAVSKGAIEGLCKALAAEYAPKIRVNAVAPSLTDTPLASKLLSSDEKKEANAQRHPLKRIGTAEDIAQTAAFLLSENSSWITGQIIHVDGGMSSVKV